MIVGDDDVVERRNVEIGSKYDDMVVVRDGLNGNELVVIDGIQRSRRGAKVSPKETQLSEVKGTLEVVEGSQSPIEDESAIPAPEDGGSAEAARKPLPKGGVPKAK